jgi:hypothetical protein
MPLIRNRFLTAILLLDFFKTDIRTLLDRLVGKLSQEKEAELKGYHKLDARAREIERNTAAR